jgi:hypothetical protein
MPKQLSCYRSTLRHFEIQKVESGVGGGARNPGAESSLFSVQI